MNHSETQNHDAQATLASLSATGLDEKATHQPIKLEKVCRSSRKNRRGASAVEFAIVAPVFFLFIFGMIEFGRVVMVQQFLTNATREGARVGILDNSTTSEVNAAVNTYLNSANIQGATITVNPSPPSGAAYGAPVTVTVSVPFSQVSWLPSPMFLSGKTLTASSIMSPRDRAVTNTRIRFPFVVAGE